MHFSHTKNEKLEGCSTSHNCWVLFNICSCGAAELINNSARYCGRHKVPIINIKTTILAALPCMLKARLREKYKPNFTMIKLLEDIDFSIMWAADATDIASSIGYDLRLFSSNKVILKDTAVTEYEP